MLESLIEVLMHRDGLTRGAAQQQINDAKALVDGGADPEEILHDEFGLEPDYVWDLLD